MKTRFYLLLFFLAPCSCSYAQNYHAIQGTSVAGSLNVSNNPASIVNMQDAWDVVPLALQVKNSTNAFTILHYSLLSSPVGSQYRINGGNYSRYISNNFNVHLLNTRIALSRTQSIAFGLNLRGYTGVQTGVYNYRDTVKTLRSFFAGNQNNRVMHGQVRSNSWLEMFGTYSRTLWDNETDRLNAGITVKVTGGLSGMTVGLENAGLLLSVRNNRISYMVNSGAGTYAYSANYDEWKKHQSASQNIENFISAAKKNVAFDLGMEYMIKPQFITNVGDEDTYFKYTWKFGISLLDLGRIKFAYGMQSRSLDQFKTGITDSLLLRKPGRAKSLRAFNDSLAGIVNNLQPLTGNFFINEPARLVLNADRSFSEHFFVNAEVSLNLSLFAVHDAPFVNEMNIVSVTPRWETRRFGAYMPVLYNTHNQLWVGGALRAGPLLLGVHNLASLFADNKTQTGGGYLAFIIRPGRNAGRDRDKGVKCPAF